MATTLAPRTRRQKTEPAATDFRILVATTGQPEANGAVATAALLAKRLGAGIDVLTVVAPFPHVAPVGLHVAAPAVIDEDNRRKAHAEVEAQLVSIPGTAGWAVHSTTGWATDAIVEAARRWSSSLIVIGLGHHGVLDRLIGSETAVAIARQSRVPLLAVPEDIEELPTNAIAAVDFTPSSEAAARLAAAIVQPTGTVTLVHTTMLAADADSPGSLADLYTSGVRDRLEALAQAISAETGRHVRTAIQGDTPADFLLDAVDHDRCDLVALGSHARGLIDRLLMRSVRAQVLRRGTCPVLVAPE